MQHMKFSRLSLLSQKERSGFQISFSPNLNAIVAGNGFGKSAILKSLYEALGAKPHKIDQSWKDAAVLSCLEFSIEGKEFVALKVEDNFTLLDGQRNALIQTTHITSELGPRLAQLLDFRLVLVDKQEKIRIPPPSYAFAPYYIDQDRSWQKPWDSFKDLSMFSNSARTLSDYHSGLRPNSYYEPKARKDALAVEMNKLDIERYAVNQALGKVREARPEMSLTLNLENFAHDTDRLISESKTLHDEQTRYRSELASLNEEANLWHDHIAIVESALRDLDEAFTGSLGLPPEVECPMCGQHYHNRIVDQFQLKADQTDLLLALQTGQSRLKEVLGRISIQRGKLDGVAASLSEVEKILAISRQDISLKDVIAAEGYNEAQRVLQVQVDGLDRDVGERQRLIDGYEADIRESEDPDRKASIKSFFERALTKFAGDLDVRLPQDRKLTLQGLYIGRGSEGPRSLAAYYYSFLHTARAFGSATFCPIVVDAPNQQGQDTEHLKQVLEFLLTMMPAESQVIIGTETSVSEKALRLEAGWKKDRLLRPDLYDEVRDYMRRYIGATRGDYQISSH